MVSETDIQEAETKEYSYDIKDLIMIEGLRRIGDNDTLQAVQLKENILELNPHYALAVRVLGPLK